MLYNCVGDSELDQELQGLRLFTARLAQKHFLEQLTAVLKKHGIADVESIVSEIDIETKPEETDESTYFNYPTSTLDDIHHAARAMYDRYSQPAVNDDEETIPNGLKEHIETFRNQNKMNKYAARLLNCIAMDASQTGLIILNDDMFSQDWYDNLNGIKSSVQCLQAIVNPNEVVID